MKLTLNRENFRQNTQPTSNIWVAGRQAGTNICLLLLLSTHSVSKLIWKLFKHERTFDDASANAKFTFWLFSESALARAGSKAEIKYLNWCVKIVNDDDGNLISHRSDFTAVYHLQYKKPISYRRDQVFSSRISRVWFMK